jgi:hypothetical protein
MNERPMKTRAPQKAPSGSFPGRAWIILAVVLLFVIAVRIRLLDIPLERDEGEYAYMGQLILQGIPPYTLAYTMKFPGTALMYALFMALFGQTLQGVHLGLLVVNCVSAVLVFLIGRRLFGDTAAVVAAISYAVLSLNHSVLGFAAHATHFVVLMALGGALALLTALDKDRPVLYFPAGMLFGLAFLMKQPGIFFVLFGALYLAYYQWTRRPPVAGTQQVYNLAFYAGGALVPLCIVVAWCALSGSLDRFWFWTVTYMREYGTMVPWSSAPSRFTDGISRLVDGFTLLWCLVVGGILAAFWDGEKKGQRIFLLLLGTCGFLAFCPGFYFRSHYFITFLPAAALAAGYGVDRLWQAGSNFARMQYLRFAGVILFILAITLGLSSERSYFFVDSSSSLLRRFYSYNPFIESVEIAKFIRSKSDEKDTIAVFGSEPQIYFYANRHSATGHIYMYGMMEDHPYNLIMQHEMIREVEAARPRFIVFTPISGSWLTSPRSDRSIIAWLSGYLRENYMLVGIVDILTDETTIYNWYEGARKYKPRTPRQVLVLERKLVKN